MQASMVAVLAFLALPLAGCLGPAAPAAAPNPPPAPEGPPFTDTLLPGTGLGGEPNVAIASDGRTVYVVAPSYTPTEDGNRVWRGDLDTGEWTDLGLVAEEWSTNDADINVSPDGSVWVATMWADVAGTGVAGRAKCTAVSVPRDRGASWNTNGLGCGPSPLFDERPWLAAAPDRTFLLHYQQLPNLFGLAPPAVSSSSDNTVWDWRPAATVPSGLVSPLAHRDGALLFANFALESGAFIGPTVETSTDDGLTWTATPVARERNDMRHPGFGLADGRGILTWIRLRDGDNGSELRASFRDGAGPWGEPVTLEGSGTSAMAWANGNGGHLAVAWLHTGVAAHPCEVPQDAEWRLRVWADGSVRELPTVIHRGPLFSAIFSGDCFREGRGLGDYIAAAVAPDGRVVVATPIDTAEDARPFAAPVHVFVVPPAP